MPDRRRAPRLQTLQGAQVIDQHNGAAIVCVVRNLSATGACLLVVSHDGVPDSFDLTLNGDKSRYPCRVLWRTANQVGVEFQVTRSSVAEPKSFAEADVPALAVREPFIESSP
jgi:PilZ domain-containing protein